MTQGNLVCTVSSPSAIKDSMHRKVVYDAGYWYIFYYDGTEWKYRSTLDGVAFSSPLTAIARGYYGRCGGLDAKIRESWIHVCSSYRPVGPYTQYFRRGSPAAGVIAWGPERIPHDETDFHIGGSVDKSTTGRIWAVNEHFITWYKIAYEFGKSDDLGHSWTEDYDDTTDTMDPDEGGIYIVRLTAGKMMAIWKDGDCNLGYYYYNGAFWSRGEFGVTAVSGWGGFSVCSLNDYVYLAYLRSDNKICFRFFNGAVWGTDTIIQEGVTATSYPLLVNNDDGDLLLIWAGSPLANRIYAKTRFAGVWDGAPTEIINESSEGLTGNELLSCGLSEFGIDRVGLLYLTGSSTYNLKFYQIPFEKTPLYVPSTGKTINVEPDVWGGVLRKNPSGSYTDYLARLFELKMGITRTGGSFEIRFSDPEWSVKDVFSDLQEVWVGVQKGPNSTVWNGTFGRKWLAGGWILNRKTTVDQTTRKKFVLEGFDYMSLMPYTIFATPDNPKEYIDIDVGEIAEDCVDAISAYGFSKAPGADFVETTGVHITRTYEKFETISSVMADLCDRLTVPYDWKIDHLKRVFFCGRGLHSSAKTIDFDNLRSGSFVWGNAKELVTNVWATDAELKTLPENPLDFTLTKWNWYCPNSIEVHDVRDYYLGKETPPGIYRETVYSHMNNAWGISSYTGTSPPITQNVMKFPIDFDLYYDLRNWTHLSFDFKPMFTDGSITYFVYLICGPTPSMEYGFYYIFTSLMTEADPIKGEWYFVSLRLPDLDEAGNVENYRGWSPIGTGFDPKDIRKLKWIGLKNTGWPWNQSVARAYFSRICYQEAGDTGLYSPPRTIVVVDKELDTRKEAKERALAELELRKYPKRYVVPKVDGDPAYIPSDLVTLNLKSPFLGATRIINEVQHKIAEDSKYISTLSLSESSFRAPPIFEAGDVTAYSHEIALLLRRGRSMGIGKHYINK